MNKTDKDYFTFNVGNSILLVGQTGSGKSYLLDALFERLVKAKKPEELQFVIFDMTLFEVMNIREGYPEYVELVVTYDTHQPDEMMQSLEKYADLAEAGRTGMSSEIIILIEECDMAAAYPGRFHDAVSTINRNAAKANMKLIFSTSRPSVDIVPANFRDSFDIILCGLLASKYDEETLGVPGGSENTTPYSFIVKENEAA